MELVKCDHICQYRVGVQKQQASNTDTSLVESVNASLLTLKK